MADVTLRIIDHFSRELSQFSAGLNSSQAAAAKLSTGVIGTGNAVSNFAAKLSRYSDDGSKAVLMVSTLRGQMVAVQGAFESGNIGAREAAMRFGGISEAAKKMADSTKDAGSANQVLKSELEQVGREARGTANHFKQLTLDQQNAADRMADLKQQAVLAGAILAGFGVTLVAAFKFGELGAQV